MQLLWCCGRHSDHAAFVPAVQSCVSRAIQSDRVLDIPVMLTVQFLNKVVDMVRLLPMVQTVQLVHRQGRRHPWFRTVESASDSVIDRAQ